MRRLPGVSFCGGCLSLKFSRKQECAGCAYSAGLSSSPILSPGLVGISVSICLALPPGYAGHRSLMDSSLDVRDRQEINRTGCRSRYRRYIMCPMWFLVPGEDSSTGNVTGGVARTL